MRLRNVTSSSSKGFSSVEMVITIVIIGILAIVVIPAATSTTGSVRLQGAAGKLLADIQYVRANATAHHDTYGLEFKPDNNEYDVYSFDGVNKTILSDPHTGNAMTMNFENTTQLAGVTLDNAGGCAAGCTEEIRFNAMGEPIDSLGNLLNAAFSITLGVGNATRTIQIEAETGYSRIL